MSNIIGVDPGFGNFKVATIAQGQVKVVAVPSVVGVGTVDMGLLGEMGQGSARRSRELVPDQISFNDVTYLVGHNVAKHCRPVERMDFRRLGSGAELQSLFYDAMFRLLGPGTHSGLSLMVGLPVTVMQNREQALQTRRELRASLGGTHQYRVNGEAVTLEVNAREIEVLAQPAGSYFHWSLNADGTLAVPEEETKLTIAICDIGYNTLDLFTLENNTPVKRFTAGDTAGMRRAAELIISTIQQDYDIALSLHEADSFVRGRHPELRTARGIVDLRPMVAQAKDAVASAIVALIERQWGNAKQFAYVLFTGGGAEILRADLTRHYPQGIVLADPVTANAAGLAKFAQYIRP